MNNEHNVKCDCWKKIIFFIEMPLFWRFNVKIICIDIGEGLDYSRKRSCGVPTFEVQGCKEEKYSMTANYLYDEGHDSAKNCL